MACNVLLLLALLAQTRAQLSLYIPDTDPQPLSAVELGVGNDGRTTWEILPGEPTGSWVSQVEDFPTRASSSLSGLWCCALLLLPVRRRLGVPLR
ncbi:hypothetical protein CALCODRAFT_485767 [Calocera cornea HHB12733]|uniref:Uncharacterized protein n=1 Tax=Calocera cornea HHB12733 TaxID=1353952 RepID=A0A165E615_9BASI|nr:hypothetical protein CALCODRAFT_485767 [Calocera cornea HHB12733]